MKSQHPLKLRWIAASLAVAAFPGQAATNTVPFVTDMRCGEVRAKMVSVCNPHPEPDGFHACFTQTLSFHANRTSVHAPRVIAKGDGPDKPIYGWHAYAWSCTLGKNPKLAIDLSNYQNEREEETYIFNKSGQDVTNGPESKQAPFRYGRLNSIKTSASE